MKNTDKFNCWTMLKNFSDDLILDYILGETTEEIREKISIQIETDDTVRELYLRKKREFDIERFFDGELTSEEESELLELVKSDKELRRHFKLFRDINNFLHLMIIEEEYHNELRKSGLTPKYKGEILELMEEVCC